jgi:hypothetical protein
MFTSHSSRSRRISSAGPKTGGPHKHIPFPILPLNHFNQQMMLKNAGKGLL